jgi:hypothetical protein
MRVWWLMIEGRCLMGQVVLGLLGVVGKRRNGLIGAVGIGVRVVVGNRVNLGEWGRVEGNGEIGGGVHGGIHGEMQRGLWGVVPGALLAGVAFTTSAVMARGFASASFAFALCGFALV